ncbi:archease [Nonomuraea terrae]|uniref:Archease n=1 Tax=Nonomuraea terrae TaxID=2530383 RepID=A0A4R4YQA0_9ACTN|nr:archease [Nonomuraea terrae]TDD47365.1 archease [Nonomuraea terrae]
MSRGHRTIPHTADIALEAWADSREECLAEVVKALVESFADAGSAASGESVAFTAPEEGDEELLAALLEEVIYQLEVHGRLTVDVVPDPAGTGLRLVTVPAEAAEQVGATPKAVTGHDVRFGQENGRWHARVVVDV